MTASLRRHSHASAFWVHKNTLGLELGVAFDEETLLPTSAQHYVVDHLKFFEREVLYPEHPLNRIECRLYGT